MLNKIIPAAIFSLPLWTMTTPAFADDDEWNWDFNEGILGVRISENWVNDFDNTTVEVAPGTYDEFTSDGDFDQIGWGLFLGAESEVIEDWLFQFGIGYDVVNFDTIKGDVLGNDHDDYDGIDYQYQLHHQRLNAEFKLLREIDNWLPYVTASLGAAWNKTSDYKEVSDTVGELARDDLFESTNEADFSFSVGLGIEREITENWRWGLGYLYTDAGDANLKATRTGEELSHELHIQEVMLQLNLML